MSKLILMSGIPGSGKSYWAQQYIPYKNILYVSRDQVRFSLVQEHEEYFSKEKQVLDTFIQKIDDGLANNYTVVADATHLNKKSRDKVLNKLKNHPDETIVIFLDTPINVALHRNSLRKGREKVPEEQIIKMYNSIELPTEEEHIDYLYIAYKDEPTLVRKIKNRKEEDY